MASTQAERSLQDLARRQHGVVTRAQLTKLGVGDGALRCRVRAGRLRRLHHGVYQVGPVAGPRAREMAAVLACGPRAYVSHGCAMALRGWIASACGSEPIDVLVVGRRVRARAGIHPHYVARLDDHETTTIDGIPAVTLGRALVDFAGTASLRKVEAAVAWAEREGLITPNGLSRLPDLYAGVPGIVRIRGVLEAAGGPALTRSEAEALFLELIRVEHLPIPEVNSEVAGCEIDFFWPRERFAVEIDGFRWHSSRPSFERDRRRTVHLAAAGIQVVRLTWRQVVDDRKETADQLRTALALAGTRRW